MESLLFCRGGRTVRSLAMRDLCTAEPSIELATAKSGADGSEKSQRNEVLFGEMILTLLSGSCSEYHMKEKG